MRLKIKETLAKIIGVFTGAEDITMASGEPGIRAERSDTGARVGFIVGIGGINHGVYSYKLSKWLINGDNTHTYVDGYKMDLPTNNTADTWVPVINGTAIQHRVIPANANSNCTKVGSYWTNGNITLRRRGNIVQCTGDPTLAAITGRQTIATIPVGFRPVTTAYAKSLRIILIILYSIQTETYRMEQP